MESKEAVKLAYIEFQKDFDDGEEINQWLTNVIEGLKQAERDLEVLETINSKRFLLFSKRKKLAKEYEDWCLKNNVLITDSTNMVTWFLCIKLKEWLENEK